MTSPVVVAVFATRHEGELARGFLDRAGLPSALFADDAGGAEAGLTFVNPARLVVRPEDEGAARAVLHDAGYGDVLEPQREAAPEPSGRPEDPERSPS